MSRKDAPVHQPTRSVHTQSSLSATAATTIRTAVAREPGLSVVGVAGIGVALVCLVGVAVHGRFVPPEGKMLDAATFCFGVGVFTLTVALLLPLAGYAPEARRRWRRGYYVFPIYGLALESIQAFRGLDPRFTEEGERIDEIAGLIFGLTASSNTVLFVVLGLRFFRSDVLADRPVLRLGIRYGVTAVALSFAVGIVMSINSGRDIGDDGNLLLSHGLGVHGIQTIPAVALLVAAAEHHPKGHDMAARCWHRLARRLHRSPHPSRPRARPAGGVVPHRADSSRTGRMGDHRWPHTHRLARNRTRARRFVSLRPRWSRCSARPARTLTTSAVPHRPPRFAGGATNRR